jgi:chemotaxis protein CheX
MSAAMIASAPLPPADLDPVIRGCCGDLFGDLLGGRPPEDAPEPGAVEREIVSFIDLGGTAVRATMAVSTPFHLARASHPRRRKNATDEEILDWAAEMLNQVAGRVANRLGARGVDIQIGIPGSILARKLQLFCTGGAHGRDALVFEGYGIKVYLNLGPAGPAPQARDPGQAGDCAREGDVLLF